MADDIQSPTQINKLKPHYPPSIERCRCNDLEEDVISVIFKKSKYAPIEYGKPVNINLRTALLNILQFKETYIYVLYL